MRRLATLDPKYTENIAFYLVGSDPTQTVAVLEQDRQKQGYPWSVAGIGSSGLRDLHILQQSTKIAIDGNAGWALGDNLMAGKITLTKDAGASVGSTMRGGELFVGGNAGARAGISMKGGTLIVGGNAGFLTGFMMQKGRIIVCGDVGEAVGDSMYEGAIYVGGEIGSLGTDAKTEEIGEDELLDILATLESHGIKQRYTFTKVVSAKKLYHFDSLERLEKTVI